MLQLSNADKSDETEQPGGHDDIDLDLDTEEDNNNNTNNQNNTTLATSITSSINYFGQQKQQMPTNMLSADSNNTGNFEIFRFDTRDFRKILFNNTGDPFFQLLGEYSIYLKIIITTRS